MVIRVKLFSTLAELVGAREISVEYKPGITIRDIARILAKRNPKILELLDNEEILTALNHRYADPDTEVHDEDEVAFMPPVSGG
ncbi:MAG TPA: MoaD/ThiS family protein [Euryarchaeota archaeon]|nr:MoaD/ThiS family protein [Euryarchaeota archaeon]